MSYGITMASQMSFLRPACLKEIFTQGSIVPKSFAGRSGTGSWVWHSNLGKLVLAGAVAAVDTCRRAQVFESPGASTKARIVC